jgi:hypothetical protein
MLLSLTFDCCPKDKIEKHKRFQNRQKFKIGFPQGETVSLGSYQL